MVIRNLDSSFVWAEEWEGNLLQNGKIVMFYASPHDLVRWRYNQRREAEGQEPLTQKIIKPSPEREWNKGMNKDYCLLFRTTDHPRTYI